ncbi:MAG: hypothetical protein GQ559_01805 [Desulfobulbaceae bacterium]|nr:hypothetical protein [Desulfobulbaceae bacterium]
MIERKVLNLQRVRKISGSFSFVEHRFLRSGFWQTLSQHELLLYFFLTMVADRLGLSYYSYDKICTLLALPVDFYIVARDGLIDKDLIAFDGHLFQVLSLPKFPISPLVKYEKTINDPATIHQLIKTSLQAGKNDE